MVLRKNDLSLRTWAAPLLGALLLPAGLGCGTDPTIGDADVIVARADTACAPVKGPVVLGEADSAFGCRGALLDSGGSVVGAARATKEDAYTLFVAFEKEGLDTRASEHRGNTTALVPTPQGFMFFSVEGNAIRVTTHNNALAPGGEAQRLTTSDGAEITALAAFGRETRLGSAVKEPVKTLERADEPAAVKTLEEAGGGEVKTLAESRKLAPVVVAVALTHQGADVFYLDASGAAFATRRVVSWAEMPYCNSVRGGFVDDASALTVVVGCQEVLPTAPTVEADTAKVADFGYDGDIPPQIGVEASLDREGRVTSAALIDLTELPPPRYELVRYVTEQLPRSAGQRVNVMDAIAVGEDNVVALACVGPDGGAVELQATLLSCQGLPR